MRVLLSAYSCMPGGGSEPGIGWNWAKSIAANGHCVTVITRTINRDKIEAYLAKNPIDGLSFLFCDLPPVVQRIYKLPLGNYTYYLLWQVKAAALARRAHVQNPFDLVQHITWGSFRVASFMGTIQAPFIFGPVAGGEDTPASLRAGLGFRGRLWDFLRRVSSSVSGLWMGSTYRAASQIVLTTKETQAKVPARFRHKTVVCQAVGIDITEFPRLSGVAAAPSPHTGSERFELLFVGRLIAWKGLHLVIRALAQVASEARQIHLTVIGSGPDGGRLRGLAQQLKADEHITWVPWMPREDVLQNYSKHQLFTFTSLHDSGGVAVLEAMVYGLPVVCLDLGGPGILVDNDSGRVISTAGKTEERVVHSIAEFFREAMANPELLARLSQGAQARVANLTWDANVRAVYEKLWPSDMNLANRAFAVKPKRAMDDSQSSLQSVPVAPEP